MLNNMAIVTGTSSGIGEALAMELLKRGWQVIGISRRPASIENAAYKHLSLDLSDVDNLASQVDSNLGRLTAGSAIDRYALVNSAASPGLTGTIENSDPTDVLQAYAINVVAPAYLMAWLAGLDTPDSRRLIVNISSGVTEGAFPGMSTYGGTKVALRMTGMVLAAELDASAVDSKFCVHSYDPGPVDTPMQTTVRNTSAETLPIVSVFEQFAEQGMLSKPGDHAIAIADFLESDNQERYSEQRYTGAPETS